MSILSKLYFHNEEAAYAKLESIVWPNGPVCPHCGATDRIYDLKGKTARPGLRKCGHCRKQFTVKVGTVFESSHVPLYKWLQATYLMCASKKGISAHQLHRTLEVTYKTAWFMEHRLREAMRSGDLTHLWPLRGEKGPRALLRIATIADFAGHLFHKWIGSRGRRWPESHRPGSEGRVAYTTCPSP